jgi:hypothetical protein
MQSVFAYLHPNSLLFPLFPSFPSVLIPSPTQALYDAKICHFLITDLSHIPIPSQISLDIIRGTVGEGAFSIVKVCFDIEERQVQASKDVTGLSFLKVNFLRTSNSKLTFTVAYPISILLPRQHNFDLNSEFCAKTPVLKISSKMDN